MTTAEQEQQGEKSMEKPMEKSYTFCIREGEYQAVWRGQVSPTVWNSRGAALAWIAGCEAANKFRH